jgi:uncharacterized protein (UPF0548 family)
MDRFVRRVSGTGYNTPLGLTTGERAGHWIIDDVEAIVGVGPQAFDAAAESLRSWQHADLDWFHVHRPESTRLEVGTVVAYSVRVLGLWWSFACRIVQVVDTFSADGEREYGYVYATIGRHAARGEERVTVRLDPRTQEVLGSILAVSRPARWYVWLAYPLARSTQKLFKPAALAALARAVRVRTEPATA